MVADMELPCCVLVGLSFSQVAKDFQMPATEAVGHWELQDGVATIQIQIQHC